MEVKRLGDIATYINGYAFKPEDRGTEGLPIIRIQDLTGNSYDLGYYNREYPERIEINDGDVLISWSASLGVYVWNRGKALLNQHIFKVVFDKLVVDKKYFVFAIKYNLKTMESKTHGATMKHIIKKDFDNTTVPFPAIQRQAEIADTLSKVERVIEARKIELQKLDELIKARFVEMFGNPLKNTKNWKTDKLQNLAPSKVFKGEIEDTNGKYWLLNLDMIESNTGIIIDKVMVDEDEIGSSTYVFSPENVLYSKLRPYLNKVVEPNDYGYATTELVPLYPKKDVINKTFLANLLRGDEFVSFINSKTAGAKMPRVSMGVFWDIELIVPPIELQNQFADFVQQVDKSKVVA